MIEVEPGFVDATPARLLAVLRGVGAGPVESADIENALSPAVDELDSQRVAAKRRRPREAG